MLQNYGTGVGDVFRRLQPLLHIPIVQQAIMILERDFATIDSVGPFRVAEFLGDREDTVVRADAAGAVRSLLGLLLKNS